MVLQTIQVMQKLLVIQVILVPPTGTPTNGVIAATGLAGGLKLAQSSPTIAGKVASVAGGVTPAMLRSAILAKNVSGNLSANIGNSKFISTNDLANILGINLTGNDLLDLLSVLQIYQNLSILFLKLNLLLFNNFKY